MRKTIGGTMGLNDLDNKDDKQRAKELLSEWFILAVKGINSNNPEDTRYEKKVAAR